MLISGTWTALLLYIFTGLAGIYFSAFEEESKARILKSTLVLTFTWTAPRFMNRHVPFGRIGIICRKFTSTVG